MVEVLEPLGQPLPPCMEAVSLSTFGLGQNSEFWEDPSFQLLVYIVLSDEWCVGLTSSPKLSSEEQTHGALSNATCSSLQHAWVSGCVGQSPC
jgi:hypothetical protein